jgi:hypothetical protein
LHVVRQPRPYLAIASKHEPVGEEALLAYIPPTTEKVGPDPPLGAVGVADVPVITPEAVTAVGLVTLRAIAKIEVHARQRYDIVGHDPCSLLLG